MLYFPKSLFAVNIEAISGRTFVDILVKVLSTAEIFLIRRDEKRSNKWGIVYVLENTRFFDIIKSVAAFCRGPN
jgi:hypothetical protein